MKKAFVLITLLASLSTAAYAAAEEVLGAMSPMLSPDGRTLVFSYQGDIWTASSEGGTARRLTVHEAEEVSPAFSPDGRWIAFSSNRFGNMDVFVMTADGGEPRRLTYNSSDDEVVCFSPDSGGVLFESYRDWLRFRMWKVPVEGGEPVCINKEEGAEGRLSPDGSRLLFIYNYMGPYRKGYRGPSNGDLWIRDLEKDAIERITDYDGVDRDPLWTPGGDAVLFVSDRDSSVFNIWKKDLATGTLQPVTAFTSGNIFSPEVAFDGSAVVYVHDFEICRTTMAGATTRIPLQTASDYRSNLTRIMDFAGKADEVAWSPDEKQAAFIQHGEVFAVSMDGGEAMRLTVTPARESDLAWHPDGESLYFLSDTSGVTGIYRVVSDQADEKRLYKARFHKVEEIVREEDPILYARMSPDGKTLVYFVDGRGLFRCDTDGAHRRPCIQYDAFYRIVDVGFSPDSKWLTYSRDTSGWNFDVYLLDLAGGREWNVSRNASYCFEPRFSPDGKRLFYTSYDDEDAEIYAVWLTLEEHQKYRDDEEDKDKDKGKAKPDDEDKDKKKRKDKEKDVEEPEEKKPEVPEVKIDLEGIHERVERLIHTSGDDRHPSVSPDGKTLLFVSDALDSSKLYAYDVKKKSIREVADLDASQLTWSRDGDKVFYARGDGFGTLDPKSGQASPVSFNGSLTIDVQAEYLQMYREAWMTLKYNFYDGAMHGVDWDAVYAYYLPLVRHCRSSREFQHAVNMMLGELNASHLGIWNSDGMSGKDTGFLGVRLGGYEKGKGYLVTDVIENTPADRVESMILPGEFLHAINRTELSPVEPMANLLEGTVGKLTDIEIVAMEGKDRKRTVTLKPIRLHEFTEAGYEAWIKENERLVNVWSEGAVGYVHIRSMSQRSLRRFERDVFGRNWDRQALVIDVRYNPGGYIHNELIDLLDGEAFGYSVPRNGQPMYHPIFKWRKPTSLLINERSFSDAEVFPNAYQTLGLGTVVGMPTFGGVIGTGGRRLLDGSWFRVPTTGWYTIDGRNMENTGATPDVMVDRSPTEIEDGRDSQLKKAVELLLEEIGE
ncbi:PD40 domain-containing protein [bacterium]|nr:PD40 domain-containing protein [candidate division CSSED10-310 bacterium]